MLCMTTLAAQVRAWRNSRGLSTTKLAELVGTSRQNIDNPESGDVESPRYIVRLAAAMGVTVEDLLRGPGHDVTRLVAEVPVNAYAPRADANNVADGVELRRVPLINRVPGGEWETLVDAAAPGDAERYIDTTANVGPHGFALTVTGHSMVSASGPYSFPPGTVVFVNPDIEAQQGHFVVVRHNLDTEFTFKRLMRDAGRWVLEPLNPRYDVLPLPADAHICGVVVKAEINTLQKP